MTTQKNKVKDKAIEQITNTIKNNLTPAYMTSYEINQTIDRIFKEHNSALDMDNEEDYDIYEEIFDKLYNEFNTIHDGDVEYFVNKTEKDLKSLIKNESLSDRNDCWIKYYTIENEKNIQLRDLLED